LTACSSAPTRVEVQLIEPPAALLVERPMPVWTPGGMNADLGEYARKLQDWGLAAEADKAAIARFIADMEKRHGGQP